MFAHFHYMRKIIDQELVIVLQGINNEDYRTSIVGALVSYAKLAGNLLSTKRAAFCPEAFASAKDFCTTQTGTNHIQLLNGNGQYNILITRTRL